MKQTVEHLLRQALAALQQSGEVPAELNVDIKVDRSKDSAHGDYASNLALILAKPCRQAPRNIAELLVQALPEDASIEKVEIAGAGFINFFIRNDARSQIITDVLTKTDGFGRSTIGQNQKVLVEFVSANPTGPLHVGHGRSAAFGATLCNVLSAAGYDVNAEYYVNDAGRQMNILAASVWLRYLELAAEPVVFLRMLIKVSTLLKSPKSYGQSMVRNLYALGLRCLKACQQMNRKVAIKKFILMQ